MVTIFAVQIVKGILSILVLDVPGAPSKPIPENVDATTISITWNPPESDGGSPVTGYIIERCDVSRGRWVRANREKVRNCSLNITTSANKDNFQIAPQNNLLKNVLDFSKINILYPRCKFNIYYITIFPSNHTFYFF